MLIYVWEMDYFDNIMIIGSMEICIVMKKWNREIYRVGKNGIEKFVGLWNIE